MTASGNAMDNQEDISGSGLRALAARSLSAGLHAFRAIRPVRTFSIEQLCKKYRVEPRGLIHLGANDGLEAASYERCGFKRVLWVEGYPKFFSRLVERLTQFPSQRALNVLISDRDDEEVVFRVARNGVSSTTQTPGAKFFQDFPNVQFEATETLRAQRMDGVLTRDGIDVTLYNCLVIDLEGSELKALRSLGHMVEGFDWIAVEISVAPNYVSGPRLSDIDTFLGQRHFKRVETVMGSSSGDALYKRTIVSTADRVRMRLSSAFYTYAYYRLYRDLILKSVKQWLRAQQI
jgi:FkbM family methyltransferase